jgi:hypothetical protein
MNGNRSQFMEQFAHQMERAVRVWHYACFRGTTLVAWKSASFIWEMSDGVVQHVEINLMWTMIAVVRLSEFTHVRNQTKHHFIQILFASPLPVNNEENVKSESVSTRSDSRNRIMQTYSHPPDQSPSFIECQIANVGQEI